MARGVGVEVDRGPGGGRDRGPVRGSALDEARMAADREVIQATLLRTRFNIARAAQELSVSRMTLYRLMEKYDIRRDNI